MKRTVICLGVALSLGLASLGRTADEPKSQVIDLWPSAPPGEAGKVGDETAKTDKESGAVTRRTNVSKPTLTVRAGIFPIQVTNPGPAPAMPQWENASNRVFFLLNLN